MFFEHGGESMMLLNLPTGFVLEGERCRLSFLMILLRRWARR